MTFKKNVPREKQILYYWRLGNTIEKTSLVTGIPAGSIGYYFKKFNKDPEKYQKVVDGEFQDAPKSSPSKIAQAMFIWSTVLKKVATMVGQGKYGEARDFLECTLLFDDLYKRLLPTLNDYDNKEFAEVVENVIAIFASISEPSSSTNIPSIVPQNTLGTNVTPSDSTLSNINVKQDTDNQDKAIDPKHLKWNPIKGRFDDTSYSFDKVLEKWKKDLDESKDGFILI
jgi:hypothetical protein